MCIHVCVCVCEWCACYVQPPRVSSIIMTGEARCKMYHTQGPTRATVQQNIIALSLMIF